MKIRAVVGVAGLVLVGACQSVSLPAAPPTTARLDPLSSTGLDEPLAGPSAGSATTAISSPTTSSTSPTTSTIPVVEGPVGALLIDKIGVRSSIAEGVDENALSQGVGHLPGTAHPGAAGNIVIGGPGATHGKDFARLAELSAGDDIVVRYLGTDYTYRVRELRVVSVEDTWITEATTSPTLTLYTSHPSAPSALVTVVFADLMP